MANLFKVFVSVFLIDILTNITLLYFVGVKINQNIVLTSALFSLIVTLSLNSLGVLGKNNPIPIIKV